MSALFHHDSVVFVRIVQIIALDNLAYKKWHWLQPCAVSCIFFDYRLSNCMLKMVMFFKYSLSFRFIGIGS
jgi:hypothetical protein